MRNFKIIIQYEGTRYQGWQKQGKGSGANTLQEKFETLLGKIAGAPVEICASGRTDAGVHAWGQVANFHMDTDLTPGELMEVMNRYLPEDVAVISCEEAAPRFHARYNARRKTYRYRVLNSDVPHVFDRKFVYQVKEPLDLPSMALAAGHLEGTHDFAAFTSARKGKKSTVRTISEIRVERVGEEIRFTYTGDGFLYHMVRILTGTLLEVGLSKRPPGDIERLLAEKDRQKAGPLVPAQGLMLMEVRYD
ncbi:MAG: tRNA pseudouridine(38-40) synthase TruA [Clostridiales bacterium]|nr:MAG: tRNA pseudouridine(38-40) synthase TruA [Clostridiales bacterium]